MLRITGDINFTDGFFDTGFGVGSSIKSGADPFAKIRISGSVISNAYVLLFPTKKGFTGDNS